jgi:inner membrane protein
MHVPTHIMTGWCIGNFFPLTPRERVACMAAASLPDLDGLSYVAGESVYQTYHRLLGHNLLFAVAIATTLAALSRGLRIAGVFVLYLALAHSHLVMDYFGSGPNWPIYYLWPFDPSFNFRNQNGWEFSSPQNTTVAAVLLVWTITIAIVKRRTPVELLTPGLDERFVMAARRLIGRDRKPSA